MAPPTEQLDVEPENFHERAALRDGMNAAGVSAFAGLLVSSIQNSLSKHNAGAMGIFTRTGSTIALFTVMGGVFSFTDSFVANSREKNDSVNGAVGGCAAGLVAGASARSVPLMLGSCAGLAALIGTFDAAGKSITGSYAHATPIKAAQHGVALEGQHAENAGAGEPGWREEREKRRQKFFKQPKKSADVETSE